MKLSPTALLNLSKHKYSGIDDSILAKYVLQKYWTWCLNFVPLNIAPNLITLTGTLGIISTFLLVEKYSPFLSGNLPGWLYVLCGFSLFFYQTMDNLDGKQARRTKTSSPLGQLFDHGCDSVVCTFQSIIASSILNLGPGFLSIYQLFITTLLPFWLATWEEYHTGTLHLGFINGPDEGIVVIVLTFIITGYVGGDFWLTTINDRLPSSITSSIPNFILNIKMNELSTILISIPIFITCVVNNLHIRLVLPFDNKIWTRFNLA
eukprot:gene1560-1979_t